MTSTFIQIPGKPISQARIRVFQRGGYPSTYDPNCKEKQAIKAFLKGMADVTMFEHPHVEFTFMFPLLKSWSKKKQAEMHWLRHEVKPDIDNCIKFYLDCMDGIYFEGDQKVSLGPCRKIYSVSPKTVITISEALEVVPSDQNTCSCKCP